MFLSHFNQNLCMFDSVFLKKLLIINGDNENIALATSLATCSLLLNSISYSFYLTYPNMFSIGENSGVLEGVKSIETLSDCIIFIISIVLCELKLSIKKTNYLFGYFYVNFSYMYSI